MQKKYLAGLVGFFMVMGAGAAMNVTADETGLQAPTEPIVIDGKKPVRFPHATHLDLGLACGVCHHDAQHQPLTKEAVAAKGSADELKCSTCHNDEFANEKLRVRKEVFHSRCKTCHKAGVDGKKGPTKCSACHVKKKKKAIEGC